MSLFTNLEFFALLDSDLRAGHFAQPGLSEQGHFLLFAQRIGRPIRHVIGTNFICLQTSTPIREQGPVKRQPMRYGPRTQEDAITGSPPEGSKEDQTAKRKNKTRDG